ncbi:ankyrin repeat domain-containing protein [Wolbachia endosymbiont (group A) of Ennomos erosarius]|uniref:ankyrin repeat domain-containing protein n=1 Tax=Wolbachia endosymbiont (group A) of Ennomos erosarius TaxID=3066174 RepID=UPI003341CAD2
MTGETLSAGYGRLEVAELLISKHADVNAKNGSGLSPLHRAAGSGRLEVAKLLVDEGADINAKDKNGKTPLDIANKLGKTKVANFLRGKQSEYDRSLLDAVKNRDISKVRGLLSRGANIEAKGDRSVTPLYCAARDGYLDIAKFLLDEGADANARAGINVSAHSWTPLHTAAAHGNLDVVKLILDKRDDVDARGALSVANTLSEKNSLEIENLLEERIRRNEETTQHLIRRKRHQYSQEEGSSLSIGVRNRHSIAKEDENSLQNDEIGYNKGEATSGASRSSSWINIFAHTIVGTVKGVSQFISSPFKPAIDMEHSQPSNAMATQSVDTNGTLLLLDVFIRKITGQKYISTVDQPVSLSEARDYALNITEGFGKAVEQAAKDSKISMHRLDIDFMKVQGEVTKKIIGGKFGEILGILNSYVEKACPSREAGCPGKLSQKKFDKFMTEFNNQLDVAINQSIQQMLHNVLKTDNIKEQQNLGLSGPRTKLDDVLIAGNARELVAGRR